MSNRTFTATIVALTTTLLLLIGCVPLDESMIDKSRSPAKTDVPIGDVEQATDMQLDGTSWKLRAFSLADEWIEVVEGTEVTIEFNADGSVGGSGGCNTYFGTYLASGKELSIGGIGTTLMACLDDTMQQEATLFEAITAAQSYEVEENTLTINYGDGASLIFDRYQPVE